MGSIVGLAVAGPLGVLVGSNLGGEAAKSAIGEDTPKDEKVQR